MIITTHLSIVASNVGESAFKQADLSSHQKIKIKIKIFPPPTDKDKDLYSHQKIKIKIIPPAKR